MLIKKNNTERTGKNNIKEVPIDKILSNSAVYNFLFLTNTMEI